MITLATDFIKTTTKQLFLFNDAHSDNIINIKQTNFVGVYYSFFHELISKLIIYIGFDKLKNNFLLDLVIMRMMEPGSKLCSIALLEEYFGIKHRRQKYYESARQWLDLKSKAETIAVKFAGAHYNFNYDLVFYDVTTLYFETFESDDLHKNGFPKTISHNSHRFLLH